MTLGTVGQLLLELLFPKFCVHCGRLGTLLCDQCYTAIEFYTLPAQLTLTPCYIDAVYSAAYYAGVIRSLIKALKYQSVVSAGQICARLLYHTILVPESDAIVPVPLHLRRQRERGFNQAASIGRELGRLCGIPYTEALVRQQYSLPQATVHDRAERLSRLHDSFAVNPRIAMGRLISAGQLRRVLLIDDVCTTGSTLNECARVLKSAGVEVVQALTVAHGG